MLRRQVGRCGIGPLILWLGLADTAAAVSAGGDALTTQGGCRGYRRSERCLPPDENEGKS